MKVSQAAEAVKETEDSGVVVQQLCSPVRVKLSVLNV